MNKVKDSDEVNASDDYINLLYTHGIKAQEEIHEQVLKTKTRVTYVLSLVLLSCGYYLRLFLESWVINDTILIMEGIHLVFITFI